MNITPAEIKPMPAADLTCRVTYPSLGRQIVDSMVILGRTGLITGVGAVVLLGTAMVIAYAVAGAFGLLGFDASAGY
ncbi:hypothetical protein Q0Z83_022340 [Actinoplanes sichuanensis]|uniref:Uncharacterized protein n=1 Tax=Actinoplanes sichuanensis TaxID=512349 RepID=A0ABW4AIH2_9ACTN|nr:hypothetical protein [Actinoplanes sichuanensis]BEL04043.1 hypothetical protein Q0Z83_022340 [Actinoplanes sichuanensis]